MKLRSKAVAASLVALVSLVSLAGTAHAAAPPFEPDPSSIGSLKFFDAAGNQISGGLITDAPFAAYVQATTAGRAGDTKATLFGYLPKNGVAIGAWTGEALTGSNTYPNAAAPGALGSSPLPLITGAPADGQALNILIGDLPNTATDAYQGLYQLRLLTSGPGQPADSAHYDSVDIQITGNTWSVVYPAIAAGAPTTTTLAATPASPQQFGTPVTLTATVAPTATGSVQFFDGATAIGTQPLSGSAASLVTSTLSVGTHSLTAHYTSSSIALANSVSAPVSYVVSPSPASPTTISLAVNPGTATAFSPVTFTATTTAGVAGTVSFSDSVAGFIGTTAAGTDSFTLATSLLGEGAHTVTATFNPTDLAAHSPSTNTAPPFTLTAPAFTPDPQTIRASIPAGTLVISTPYTPASPLDLGPLTLSSSATQFSGSAPFTDISVTDTRAGNLPWTAKALAGPLSSGTNSINGQNVGLTGLIADPIAGNALTAASVVATNNPAADPAVTPADPGNLGLGGSAPHTVLFAAQGLGSIGFHGILTLNAPSSTPAGTYTGTVTFTIG
jgi:hypothetical protein